MRIKRLDITGFKSFMDRSVFSFDTGITGVVGPNGCGKSNVVDAIRWVMGEQSAKNLRGRGMEDVIFNGSETVAPLSMAEVTMTFAVAEGDALPPQYAGLPEVAVTRRLFRSGDSEYQINRTNCRLLDVTELFLGTGVGTRAYSIIEQGRVGQIVSARPEDRRSFIEEAAGVTKYKARRKAAERKMEYTQANLQRVNDIVAELERRVDSLERQVKKAEKYKKLKAEMRSVELHTQSHRYLELLAQKKVLEAQLATLTNDEREHFEQVRHLEDEIGTRRAALETEAAELENQAAEAHALQSQVQLDAQNLEHWSEDQRSTLARRTEVEGDRAALMEKRAAIEVALAQRAEELRSLLGSANDDDVAAQVAEEELRRVTALHLEVQMRLERERQALVSLATQVANHESTLLHLGERKGESEARAARLKGEWEALKSEETHLERSRTEVQDRVGQSLKASEVFASRKGEEEASLERTREAFAESEVRVIRLRENLADQRSRLTTLKEIHQNYEGYDRGVRAVMLKAGEQPREVGIWGVIADLVSTTQQYEKAVEAALGERMQHIVVEGSQTGIDWVTQLKVGGEGRSTFVPVPTGVPTVLPALQAEGVLAMAVAEVTCREEGLKPLVDQLLSGVAVVADLLVAQTLAENAKDYTFVTLDGDVLRPGPTVTGGTLEGPAVGALQKKREIAELEAEVAKSEAHYNEVVTAHYSLQKQMGHTEGVLKGLSRNLHAEELLLKSHEKDLHQAGADLGKLRDRLTQLTQESQKLDGELIKLTLDEEAARGEVAHGQNDRHGREEHVRQLSHELEALKVRADRHNEELTTLKVRVAGAHEKREAATIAQGELEAQKAEVEQRSAKAEETRAQLATHLADLEARLERKREEHELGTQLLATANKELEERRAVHNETSASVRAADQQLKSLRDKLDSLTHGLSQIAIRDREQSLELEHLVSQVQERHQLSMSEALHEFHWKKPLGPEAEPRLKELRGQVERMGEVNVTAIDEHKEVKERYDFLSKQKKDLEDSLKQLDDAITKIDRTSRERFQQTFDVVNEKFQQIFPRLFGGGRAGLVLTNEGPGLEPGVEIVAQPPGKKLQSVSLLSGGEKALTAVGMIFAIFLIKPTPFCLLDEVDAPLDEANVGRYNQMVKEMSTQSQFILITHNKRTMEVVDTLYGVTMEEPGISKLVSVRMHDAAAANSDQQVA
jgi:chromosome segregation protein